ncbi:accessory factor associated with RNA polymerase II [Dimargaris xerosporica]|nr:accessory factor associated with RNA polymerase II [Dimargaris xerosporica]
MSQQDPLFILRDHVIHDKPITFFNADGECKLAEATHVEFTQPSGGSVRFARDTPTAYKKSSSSEFYPLDSLVFLAQNRSLVYGSLLKEGVAAGISPVSYLDIKHLTEFLTGAVETNENIVINKSAKRQAAGEQGPLAKAQRHHTPNYPSIEAVQEDLSAVKAIQECERELGNLYDPLRGTKDMSMVRAYCQQHFGKGGQSAHTLSGRRPHRPGHAHVSTPTLSRSRQVTPSKPSPSLPVRRPPPSKRANRIPLVIVPAAATSLLTMYNVKDFLENQTFVPTQVLREQGMRKESQLTIERARIGNPKPLLYHVVDSVDRFKPDDWDRLVAVFTIGAPWQFKKWKWENPREIFTHVKGFYVKFADEQPKDAAQQWDVEIINVDRTKRHKDKAVVSQLWDSIDHYIARKKPYLAP